MLHITSDKMFPTHRICICQQVHSPTCDKFICECNFIQSLNTALIKSVFIVCEDTLLLLQWLMEAITASVTRQSHLIEAMCFFFLVTTFCVPRKMSHKAFSLGARFSTRTHSRACSGQRSSSCPKSSSFWEGNSERIVSCTGHRQLVPTGSSLSE